MQVEGDTDAAVSFLQCWAPEGPWVISAVDPPRKEGMITRSFTEPEPMRAFLGKWNGARNLYFTVNRPSALMNTKPKKEHIGWVTALHVDVDPEPPVPNSEPEEVAAHYASEHERILRALDGYRVPPSLIVFSGGGYQGFWLLTEPVVMDEPWIREVEARNRRIERDLGGDHCHNIDRIMRIPGTVNLPDPRKVAKGRVPTLARVEFQVWDRLYQYDDFEPLYDDEPAVEPNVVGADAPTRKLLPLPDWVTGVLKYGPDAQGDRSFGGNRSVAVYAVCCAMVRAGWNRSDIAAAISDECNKLSAHVLEQSAPPKYALRQADQAAKAVAKEGSGDPFRRLFSLGARGAGRVKAVERMAKHLMITKRLSPLLALDILRLWNGNKMDPPLAPDELDDAVDRVAAAEMDRRGNA